MTRRLVILNDSNGKISVESHHDVEVLELFSIRVSSAEGLIINFPPFLITRSGRRGGAVPRAAVRVALGGAGGAVPARARAPAAPRGAGRAGRAAAAGAGGAAHAAVRARRRARLPRLPAAAARAGRPPAARARVALAPAVPHLARPAQRAQPPHGAAQRTGLRREGTTHHAHYTLIFLTSNNVFLLLT